MQIDMEVKQQEYGVISAKMSIEVDGVKLTMQKAAQLLKDTDRNKREVVFNTISSRRLQDEKALDDLLLETFQTSPVLIDEQKLVNGEEGCLCNIDIEHFENNSKHGLFDLDLINDAFQQKIVSRINEILTVMEN